MQPGEGVGDHRRSGELRRVTQDVGFGVFYHVGECRRVELPALVKMGEQEQDERAVAGGLDGGVGGGGRLDGVLQGLGLTADEGCRRVWCKDGSGRVP